MLEDPETGLTEYRLFHLDRILFGSNTILVFKYPLQNRKLKDLKNELQSSQPELTLEQIEEEAKKLLAQ